MGPTGRKVGLLCLWPQVVSQKNMVTWFYGKRGLLILGKPHPKAIARMTAEDQFSQLPTVKPGMWGKILLSLLKKSRFLAFDRKEKATTFPGECSLITSKASDWARVPASCRPQGLCYSVTALPALLLLPWLYFARPTSVLFLVFGFRLPVCFGTQHTGW